jgi:hypothetical protein
MDKLTNHNKNNTEHRTHDKTRTREQLPRQDKKTPISNAQAHITSNITNKNTQHPPVRHKQRKNTMCLYGFNCIKGTTKNTF